MGRVSTGHVKCELCKVARGVFGVLSLGDRLQHAGQACRLWWEAFGCKERLCQSILPAQRRIMRGFAVRGFRGLVPACAAHRL